MKLPRRLSAGVVTTGLVAAGLVALSPAVPAQAAPVTISGATFTWGISGYSQVGVAGFGPWNYKNLTGNATKLTGSVSGGMQAEYAVAPFPATSMPVSSPQKTPNAIRFTHGTGTSDPATGAATLSWTGSYTINAYPALFNAPDEIYSNPELTINATTGVGSVTMNLTIGAGVDMSGNPTSAVELGRRTLFQFAAGTGAASPVTRTSIDSFRYKPAYQGVVLTPPAGETAQNTTCTSPDTWGSWSPDFANAVPSSIRPHFYSTGCGGLNNAKGPLPVDVDLGLASTEPAVSLSQTDFRPDGSREVTVTGSGFLPSAATGTRPPLAGKPGGVYIGFGKFPSSWRPSAGVASAQRKPSSLRWAVLAADRPALDAAQPDSSAELSPEGTFSTTVTISKADADRLATGADMTTYGIYTYPGSGAVNSSYETYTPVTFTAAPVVTPPVATAPATTPARQASSTTIRVNRSPKVTPRKTAGKATFTVAGPTTSGVLTVVLAKGARTRTRSVPFANGTATMKLPRLAQGRWRLTATYAGSSAASASSATTKLRVS